MYIYVCVCLRGRGVFVYLFRLSNPRNEAIEKKPVNPPRAQYGPKLFYSRAVFRTEKEIDQFETISTACGTVTPHIWPDVVNAPLYEVFKPRHIHPRNLGEAFSRLVHLQSQKGPRCRHLILIPHTARIFAGCPRLLSICSTACCN